MGHLIAYSVLSITLVAALSAFGANISASEKGTKIATSIPYPTPQPTHLGDIYDGTGNTADQTDWTFYLVGPRTVTLYQECTSVDGEAPAPMMTLNGTFSTGTTVNKQAIPIQLVSGRNILKVTELCPWELR